MSDQAKSNLLKQLCTKCWNLESERISSLLVKPKTAITSVLFQFPHLVKLEINYWQECFTVTDHTSTYLRSSFNFDRQSAGTIIVQVHVSEMAKHSKSKLKKPYQLHICWPVANNRTVGAVTEKAFETIKTISQQLLTNMRYSLVFSLTDESQRVSSRNRFAHVTTTTYMYK
jgi:hypothetical protein